MYNVEKNSGGFFMLNLLKECKNHNKVASLYFNKEDNCSHLTGFVYAFNDTELLVAHINARGEYDGFVLNGVNNLYRVDCGHDYENKISALYTLKKQKHPMITINEENILFSLLDFAFVNKLLVTLELDNNTVTGYVVSYDGFITLNIVDPYGKNNGKCIIDIDEVITFACDTDDEQDLRILNLLQKK